MTSTLRHANLAATLAEAGGKLADIVTMTVFIVDARYSDRFVEIRKEVFPDAKYPASARHRGGLRAARHDGLIQCVAAVPA